MKKLIYPITFSLMSLLFSCQSSETKDENNSSTEVSESESGAPEKKAPETIEEFEEVIKKNKEWMKGIEEKAAKKNLSIEEVIKADAKWMFDKKMKETPQAQIEKIVNKIKTDSIWSHKTKIQAEERGVSFEEMVYLNAEYTYNKKKTKEESF